MKLIEREIQSRPILQINPHTAAFHSLLETAWNETLSDHSKENIRKGLPWEKLFKNVQKHFLISQLSDTSRRTKLHWICENCRTLDFSSWLCIRPCFPRRKPWDKAEIFFGENLCHQTYYVGLKISNDFCTILLEIEFIVWQYFLERRLE